MRVGLLAALVLLCTVAAVAAPIKADIYYSGAPWDGAAYGIKIPLPPTADAPEPVIRIDLWGNPEFPQGKTIEFVPGEGLDSRGPGRAAWQARLNKTFPVDLSGTVTFRSLRKDQPVAGSYDLRAADGRTFKGTFEATWSNKPFPIR